MCLKIKFNNNNNYVCLACDMNFFFFYVVGGPYVSDQADLNRGPLIQNRFIVTLYSIHFL